MTYTVVSLYMVHDQGTHGDVMVGAFIDRGSEDR